jgi:RimJ/RimL family protein N-acetyltransferase
MARIEPLTITDDKDRTIRIRNCSSGDGADSIEFIRSIARETQFTNNPVDRSFSPPEEIDRSWEKALDAPNELHLGAFSNGHMVGQLVCQRIAPDHPYIGHIARFGMMVLRDFWGSGVAGFLVKGMDDYACSQGIVRIEAMVRADNARGRAFYRKTGFVEEGTRRRAAMIGGVWIDDIHIGKLFD